MHKPNIHMNKALEICREKRDVIWDTWQEGQNTLAKPILAFC